MDNQMKIKPYRIEAVIVGILFLVGTGAGIISLALTQPLQTAAEPFRAIAAHKNQWITGTFLILVMGLPLAMVPAVLFPILRKRNEALALGAVVFRGVLEAICYILLVINMLLMLSVAGASVHAGVVDAAGTLLLSAGIWIQLVLAIVFSIGSIMINLLFYQMRIIPRWLSLWGLIGSLGYFLAHLISLFGDPPVALSLASSPGFLMAPLAVEEIVFAVWMIARGFEPGARTAFAM